MIDLERRKAVEILSDRSAAATASGLRELLGIEIVARAPCGLYAKVVKRSAPEARQVADRLHIIRYLRQAIE